MDPIVYKEGLLFKRQRGLHQNNTRKLKFQERFCCLTSTSLDYYDPNPRRRADGPKGQFAVDHMQAVEPMQDFMFGSSLAHVFQIGDNAEIMYFACHSGREKEEWIKAFRQAAQDAHNQMQSHYHHGVFGLANKGRWSCCANPQRTCAGCSPVTSIKQKEFTKTLPAALETVSARDTSAAASAEHSSPSNSRSLPRDTKPEQEKHLMEPSTPPNIRRFTMVDPLMKPISKRLKEIRKSSELESLDLPEKSKRDEIEGILDDVSTTAETTYGDSVIKNDKGSGSDLLKIKSEVKDNDRNGTGSPSPSIDSGRGASSSSSRPGSQVIAPADDNSSVCVMQRVGESSGEHTGDKDANISSPAAVKEGPQGGGGKEKQGSDCKEEEEFGDVRAIKSHGGVALRAPSHGRMRGVSMPPPPDIMALAHEGPARPLSGSFRLDGWESKRTSMQGSDTSGPGTPLHKMMSGSPRLGDDGRPRPMSFFMRSVYGQPPSEYNKLHQACKDGNLSSLAAELRLADLMDVNELSYGQFKYTALLLAVLYDHYQAMVVLLEHGANPNCVEPRSQVSVLHWACERGCQEIADVLLKYKADVNQCDAYGRSALSSSCKNGHGDIVEMLVESGAEVDVEDAYGRSPLHEAAESGHEDIVDLLIKKGGADLLVRDANDATPYDLAFKNSHQEVMKTLHMIIPEAVRPYALAHSFEATQSCRMITSISYYGSETLVVGSRDCNVTIWDTSNTSNATHRIRLMNTVLDLHLWSNYLVIGCTSIQMVDMENLEKRRTVADDSHEDESLENPPLHLVAFGPQGQLVTAGVESNTVKIWPPQTLGIISVPQATLAVGEEHADKGCVYSLSVSPTPNHPWLAVGLQPGKLFQAVGNKLVYLYDWTEKTLCHIFDAGNGGVDVSVHVQFSPDGEQLAVGCMENLCIWETSSGNLLHKFPVTPGAAISSIQYSRDGSNLAAGLNSGAIEVFEITCSSLIFQLPGTKVPSPTTALTYSEDGRHFAAAHLNGSVQLWEVFAGQPSNA